MNRSRKIVVGWLLLYLVATLGMGWWLTRMRAAYLSGSDRPELQASWDAWKADVKEDVEKGVGPVRRRVPTAGEPPATILLRDHFSTILVTGFLVWTAMFGFLAMATTGVIRGAPCPSEDESTATAPPTQRG